MHMVIGGNQSTKLQSRDDPKRVFSLAETAKNFLAERGRDKNRFT